MANINIYGELHNDTPEGYVTPSQQIMDTELGKRQDQINRELVDEVRDMGLETAYLTCSTTGNTWKKTISAPDFALSTNVRLLIKMEHAHTSPNSPTLNINETGEYTIQYGGRGASSINSWTDNEVLDVYFDGTQYIARGVENRTGYLVCNTLANTAAKTVDCPAFNLNTYVRVLVKMTYTNTASNPTLNINGTGAKGIIYNGVAVSSENVWKASEVLDVYYDGTNFIARPYLNVDNEPTTGSNNLVKSGGVYEQVNQLDHKVYNNDLKTELLLNTSIPLSKYCSGVFYDGSKVVEATSSLDGFVFSPEPDKVYTFGKVSHALYCFNSFPKVNDVPAETILNIREVSNIGYAYILINIPLGTTETLSVANSLAFKIADLDVLYSKADLLTGATILNGWYHSDGHYTANASYSSIEVAIDNSQDFSKFAVDYIIRAAGTSTVPHCIFFNGNTVLSYYFGQSGVEFVQKIPYGTTKIAFNLLTGYSSSRGDIIKMFTAENLQQVAGKLVQVGQTLDDVTIDIETINQNINVINQEITPIEEKVYITTNYESYEKETTNSRLAVWIPSNKQPSVSQFNMVISYVHPTVTDNVFTLYKATSNHTTLQAIGSFAINTPILVTRDSSMPDLYLYKSITEEQVTPYTVAAEFYTENKDGLAYKQQFLVNESIEGKNIVVFGDSISEFKSAFTGKTWSEHATEISGANFINCAIGGTQLRQRAGIIPLFSETESYSVGDKVFNKPAGATKMNYYECINAHSGAWDANDFSELTYDSSIYTNLDIISMVKAACDTNTPIESRFTNQLAAATCIYNHLSDYNSTIVNRLKNVDWTSVDAVVIMAGTNDYNAGHFGQSGSFDIATSLGAVNEIVKQLLSTYKHLSVYFCGPIVHWADYSNGVGDDSKWCDVYKLPGYSITRKVFYDELINEFKLNHIPVINLYDSLGWHKYNFSDFFYSDGTHPTRGYGMEIIGSRIVSFIISSKNMRNGI